MAVPVASRCLLAEFVLVGALVLACLAPGCSRRASSKPVSASTPDASTSTSLAPPVAASAPPAMSAGRCLTVEETAKYTVVFAAPPERVQSIFVGWRPPGPLRTSVERDPLTGATISVPTNEPAEGDAGPAAAEWDLQSSEVSLDAGYEGYLESMIPPQIRALPHRPMKRILFELLAFVKTVTGNDQPFDALFPPSGCTTSMPLLRLPDRAIVALRAMNEGGISKLASRLATGGEFQGWSAADIRVFLIDLRTLASASESSGVYVLPV